jgi:uncharacterized membrane protein
MVYSDDSYTGGFWGGPGGIISILVGIICICIPVMYIGTSFQQNAYRCINCYNEAMQLGKNISVIASSVILCDFIIFICYLCYLYHLTNKRNVMECGDKHD